MPIVQRLLKDNAVPVRFAAALAVGDLQYALAQRDLAQLLNDQNESVRIAAAYARYRLGDTKAFDTVLHAIAAKDPTVRANAALLLGKARNDAALRYLWWVLGRDDYRVQLQAAESIAMLGDERILKKIWATALSAYADDRVMGIKALGALATPKAKDILVTKLDDDVLEVRLAAAEQLGKLGDKTGEPEVRDVFAKNLTSGLRGPELERVRVLTALAVGRICTPALTAMLPKLINDQSQTVRIAAAKAVFLCAANNATPIKNGPSNRSVRHERPLFSAL
jgi:HEAT repeat protein